MSKPFVVIVGAAVALEGSLFLPWRGPGETMKAAAIFSSGDDPLAHLRDTQTAWSACPLASAIISALIVGFAGAAMVMPTHGGRAAVVWLRAVSCSSVATIAFCVVQLADGSFQDDSWVRGYGPTVRNLGYGMRADHGVGVVAGLAAGSALLIAALFLQIRIRHGGSDS